MFHHTLNFVVFTALLLVVPAYCTSLQKRDGQCDNAEVLTPCSHLCGGGTQLVKCPGIEDYVERGCNTHWCVPDCPLCDYGSAKEFFPDYYDCSKFYICERIILDDEGGFDYRLHHDYCQTNGTYWSQSDLTCIRERGTHCRLVDRDDPAPTPPPVEGTCDFRPIGFDRTKYYWIAAEVAMDCPAGTVYDGAECGCVHGDGGPPDCARDEGLLLYFPFNDSPHDATCANAYGEVHGKVSYSSDAVAGKSALFEGSGLVLVHYMENYFAGRETTKLSISVWFKRTGPIDPLEGLVNNGNCYLTPSFNIHVGPGNSSSAGVHASEHASTDDFQVQQRQWEHAVMVYDGNSLLYYLNGVQQGGPADANGGIENRQCPMVIGQQGNDQSKGFFEGYIDELRLYTRVLTPAEVQGLFQNPAGPSGPPGSGGASISPHTWQTMVLLNFVMTVLIKVGAY